MAWAKHIVTPSEYVPYWNSQSIEADTQITDAGPATLGCNKYVLSFSRIVPAGAREDRATISFHIAKTAGALFASFSFAPDLAAAKAPIDAWWTTQKATINGNWTLADISVYVVRFDRFMTTEKGLKADVTGPRIAYYPIGIAGAGITGRNADQIACSVTLRTPSRKHWGRVYIPGINSLGANWDVVHGRFNNSFIDSTAQAMATLKNALTSAGFELGVWSPTSRSFLETMEVRVDDVPDIVRRRRPKSTNYRKILSS